MHEGFFGQQNLFGLHVIGIIDTAINGADSRTLWFVMKSYALGTLRMCDVVDVHASGLILGVCLYFSDSGMNARSLEACAFCKLPVCSTFVDGVVGAFWFTCTAIDAFVCDHNRHCFFRSEVVT